MIARLGSGPQRRHGPAPATLPPPGLPGLDPGWSRLVEARGSDGRLRTWHVLDTLAATGVGADRPLGTLLCVHGNPTWAYLWRSLLASPPPGWRVVAVDHLGMGYSERVEGFQRLADRIADLGVVTSALEIDGPVITVAHDWGGAISLGWALGHRAQLRGIVLTNTAVSQPSGSPVPGLITLARAPGVLRSACVTTPAFLEGTLRLARPALARAVRAAYRAPYASPSRRDAIGDFVEDIPLSADHPTAATLATVAAGLSDLADVPALLLWGPADPVFSDRYLRDLMTRLPHAAVHRFEGAGHLLAEDRDVAGAVRQWISALDRPQAHPAPAVPTAGSPRRPLWAALEERSADAAPAIVELGPGLGGARSVVSFGELDRRTRDLAAGLAAYGVRKGDRVALLVPPGADLAAAVYASWRAGAVVVIADAGLGVRGLSRALRGAAPDYLIGIPKALAAARALRWPGVAIAVGEQRAAVLRGLGAVQTLEGLEDLGRSSSDAPAAPGPDDEAAVLFTSGATGPAKGVVYRHRQLEAQRDLLIRAYAINSDDRLVAAFAPFALYGPALGIASAVPAMDVTAPGTLTAAALAAAVDAVSATLVFGSPAALVNVAATADQVPSPLREPLGGVRLLLSAGAPVPAALLRELADLLPHAEAHTPYGMTEALPVTDVTLAEIEAAGAGDGVCVGRSLDGVDVSLLPLDDLGRPASERTEKPYVTGEICVRGDHVKAAYDQLWLTQQRTIDEGDAGTRWHRTGDVGHLDDEGRLWVEGRLVHVITTARGVITPVGVEQRVQAAVAPRRVAAVGVGPAGTQVVVMVVEEASSGRRRSLRPSHLGAARLADAALADYVRRAAGVPVAAVLVIPALPVDIRHNSKVDRSALARWAADALGGRGKATP